MIPIDQLSATMADARLSLVQASLPYIVMILSQLSLALLLALAQNVLADGVSATIFVVYQQLIGTVFILGLALFFQRGQRIHLPFHLLFEAFFIGLLQIPLGNLLLAVSLRYITASFLSTAQNLIPGLVLVLAVITGQERLGFWSLNGMAKILGVLATAAGATVMVSVSDSGLSSAAASDGWWLGCLIVGIGILSQAVSYLLVEKLACKYSSDLTLSSVVLVFGTLQTLVVAALTERNISSWKIMSSKSLLVIIYGGLLTMGLGCFARNWCVRVKGPVFATAFFPLLILFSFLLQMLVFRAPAQLWSIFGAVLVVGGLYVLLWAKSKDSKEERIHGKDSGEDLYAKSTEDPLLVNVI